MKTKSNFTNGLLTGIAIATISVGSFYSGATLIIKNNNNPYIEQVISKSNYSEEFTENDIYDLTELTEELIKLPMRATVINHDSKNYTMLSDGQGAIYVVDEVLKDGKNYVGTLDKNIDEIVDYYESDFTFTYEDFFEKYYYEEVEVGAEIANRKYISM